jgi:hypothetical protein
MYTVIYMVSVSVVTILYGIQMTQRPDLAIHKFFRSIINDKAIPVLVMALQAELHICRRYHKGIMAAIG